MTGTELAAAVGLDLRDVGATNYRLHERLAYLKRGLRALALDLARRRSHLVRRDVLSGSADWPAAVTPGQAYLALPADFMGAVMVCPEGRENTTGPLKLAGGADRYAAGSAGDAYYLQAGRLYLAPAPAETFTLRLVYNAWPALVLAAPVMVSGGDYATADTAAAAQLADDLPWQGLFDEALRAFVTQACANRNEYDTTVELGLVRMMLTLAHEAAGLDDPPELIGDAPGGDAYDFTGRP